VTFDEFVARQHTVAQETGRPLHDAQCTTPPYSARRQERFGRNCTGRGPTATCGCPGLGQLRTEIEHGSTMHRAFDHGPTPPSQESGVSFPGRRRPGRHLFSCHGQESSRRRSLGRRRIASRHEEQRKCYSRSSVCNESEGLQVHRPYSSPVNSSNDSSLFAGLLSLRCRSNQPITCDFVSFSRWQISCTSLWFGYL
jgi:hypothetical protein